MRTRSSQAESLTCCGDGAAGLHPEGGRSRPRGSHPPQLPDKTRQRSSSGHFTSLETRLLVRTSLLPQASFPLVWEVLLLPARGTRHWSPLISLPQDLTPLPLSWAPTHTVTSFSPWSLEMCKNRPPKEETQDDKELLTFSSFYQTHIILLIFCFSNRTRN